MKNLYRVTLLSNRNNKKQVEYWAKTSLEASLLAERDHIAWIVLNTKELNIETRK
jgi:hypothetical protein